MEGDDIAWIICDQFMRMIDTEQSKRWLALYVPITDDQVMCRVEYSDKEMIARTLLKKNQTNYIRMWE